VPVTRSPQSSGRIIAGCQARSLTAYLIRLATMRMRDRLEIILFRRVIPSTRLSKRLRGGRKKTFGGRRTAGYPIPPEQIRELMPLQIGLQVGLQPGGEVVITDGPYLETKEHMGGFWMIEAAVMDEALA
jgi:YCII-related domain